MRALATEEQDRQYWADSPEEREVDNSAVLQRRREGNNFQEEERLGAEAEEQQEEDQLQEYIQERPGRRHYDVSEGTSRGQRPVPRGGRTTEDERVQSACGQQLLPSVVDPAAPPSNEGAGAAGTNIISKSSQELFLNRNQSHLLGQNMLVTPGAKVGADKNHGNPNQNSSLRPNASPLDPLSKLSSIERASSCHRLLSPIYEQDKDDDAERLFGEQTRVSPVASGERRGVVEQEEIQRQERANRDDLIGKNSLKINRSYVGGELPAAGAAAAPGAAGAFSVPSSRVHLLRAQDVAAAGQHEDQADHRNKNCGRREFFPQAAEGKEVHQNNRRGTTTNGQNENDVVDLDVVLDDQAGSSKKRQDEMAPQLSEQRERRSAPQQMSCSSTMNKARRREVGHLSRIGEHQESGKLVKKNIHNVEQQDRPTTAASRGGLAHKNQRGNGTTEGKNLRREEELQLPTRDENRRRQEEEHQKQIRLDDLHGQQELQNHGDPAAKRRRVLNIQGCTTGASSSSSNFVNLANSSAAARGAGSHQKANNSGDGVFVPSRHGGEDNHNSTASRRVAHEPQLEQNATSNAFALVPVARAATTSSFSHINNKSTGTATGNNNNSSSSSNLSSTFAKYLKVLEKLDLDFIGTTTTSTTSTCKMNTGVAAQVAGVAGSSSRGYNNPTAFGRAGREEPGAGPASAAAQGPPGGPAPPPCSQMTKKSKLLCSAKVSYSCSSELQSCITIVFPKVDPHDKFLFLMLGKFVMHLYECDAFAVHSFSPPPTLAFKGCSRRFWRSRGPPRRCCAKAWRRASTVVTIYFAAAPVRHLALVLLRVSSLR